MRNLQTQLGCALARTRENDAEALEQLERWHTAPELQKSEVLVQVVVVKLHLSRLYRRAWKPEKATEM
jgi:hypothetical protein